MTGRPAASDYPELFEEFFWEWGPIRGTFELRDSPPDAEMVAHVRVVPFVDDNVVVIQMSDGQWNHPGGTLDPGETYMDAAKRELMEEAGAHLVSFKPFGVLHCFSERPEPFRQHLPHPEFYHVVGYADVELVGNPTNPADGEQVLAVEAVSLDEASKRLASAGEEWVAQLYQLADQLRRGFRQTP